MELLEARRGLSHGSAAGSWAAAAGRSADVPAHAGDPKGGEDHGNGGVPGGRAVGWWKNHSAATGSDDGTSGAGADPGQGQPHKEDKNKDKDDQSSAGNGQTNTPSAGNSGQTGGQGQGPAQSGGGKVYGPNESESAGPTDATPAPVSNTGPISTPEAGNDAGPDGGTGPERGRPAPAATPGATPGDPRLTAAAVEGKAVAADAADFDGEGDAPVPADPGRPASPPSVTHLASAVAPRTSVAEVPGQAVVEAAVPTAPGTVALPPAVEYTPTAGEPEVSPQGFGLLADALPAGDALGLGQDIKTFLGRLEAAVADLGEGRPLTGVLPWVTVGASLALAGEITRRQRKRPSAAVLALGGSDTDTWLPGSAGPPPPDTP